jgi:hypothetical protein
MRRTIDVRPSFPRSLRLRYDPLPEPFHLMTRLMAQALPDLPELGQPPAAPEAPAAASDRRGWLDSIGRIGHALRRGVRAVQAPV